MAAENTAGSAAGSSTPGESGAPRYVKAGAGALTDYREFPDRSHYIVGEPGWATTHART